MKVRQYNSNGIYLRTYESIGEAARAVHTYQGNISNAIKLEIKSKGYYWKKAEGIKELKIKTRKYRRGGRVSWFLKKEDFSAKHQQYLKQKILQVYLNQLLGITAAGKKFRIKIILLNLKESLKDPSK